MDLQLSDFLNLGNNECDSIIFWTGEGSGDKADLTKFVCSIGEEDRIKVFDLLKNTI